MQSTLEQDAICKIKEIVKSLDGFTIEYIEFILSESLKKIRTEILIKT